MSWLSDLIWWERLWLPVGYTWKDLESTPERTKADVNDLRTIPMWIVSILVTRFLFEKQIATPTCQYLGIKFNSKDNNTNKNKPKSERTNHDKRREEKSQAKRSLLKKSTETCWRFAFYFYMLSIGTYVLLRSDWGLDGSKWFHRMIEDHEMTWDIKLYYHTELSFYLSLLVSQFFDVRRKDFYQMFIHHVATIVLISVSYINSAYRFGVVIMFLHDLADCWLEAAKLANYAKIEKICDILFGVFGTVFIVTRIGVYPIYVLYYSWHHEDNTYEHGLLTQFLVGLCYLLLLLHFWWSYLIVKMAYRVLVVGNHVEDTRSESESESGDDDCGKISTKLKESGGEM